VSSAARKDPGGFVCATEALDRLLGGGREYNSIRPDVLKLAHPEAVRIFSQDGRRPLAEVNQHSGPSVALAALLSGSFWLEARREGLRWGRLRSF
jgi:hypothetical protein